MEQIFYPICCAHMLFQSNKQLIFRTFSGKRCTFKSNLKLISALVQKSTGMFSSSEIAYAVSEELGIPIVVVNDAIDDLIVCEILMDSHKQLLKYHTLTWNPPRYPSVLSLAEIDELTQNREDYIAKDPIAVYEDSDELSLVFFDLLQRRHSCRSFLERPVEMDKLFALCKAAYSSQMRPVASAGALFPLSIYFMSIISSDQMPAGLYQYDPQKERLLLLNTDLLPENVQYALNDGESVFGAPCIFFVCADLSRQMKKYANAGYKYTLLEAGHAIQNMTVVVAELGLGGVEYGGYCDEAIKKMFQLPEMVFPLACYATGYEDTERKQTKYVLQTEAKKCMIEKIVRNKLPNVNSFFAENEYFSRSNIRVVVSRYEYIHGCVEFGTGIAPAYGIAYMKSIMEAYERYVPSLRYFDRLERADRLGESYLDPSECAPYSEDQRKKNGLLEFRADAPVEWLQGYDLNGRCVYVPADLCFYVSRKDGILYHVANSSGCATHFELDAARQAALLELIERDAVVKNWLYRQTPDQLEEMALPAYIRQRRQQYQAEGVSVFILALSCEYAYTVLVCSVNDLAPPYFVAGAGASFVSADEAVAKAFDEWEVSYVLGGADEDTDAIAPEEVASPGDHGRLYRYTNYNKEIDYLLKGRSIGRSELHLKRLGDIRELTPVFVNYRASVDGVYVVRAFSKELIPINFGYEMDFFNHFKIDRELLKYNGFPHFFS